MDLSNINQENSAVTIKPLAVKANCYIVLYQTQSYDSFGTVAVFFDKISADEHAEYLEKLSGEYHYVIEAPLV